MTHDEPDVPTAVLLQSDLDKLRGDQKALVAIHELLDGIEWNCGTIEEVAQIVIAAGYPILDIDGVPQV